MTNEPKDERAKTSADKNVGQPNSSEIERLTTAYFEWVQAVNSAWLHYREACGNAYNEMIEAQRKALQEAWGPAREAHDRQQQAATTAFTDKDGWAKWVAAQQEYLKAQIELHSNEKLREASYAACQRFAKNQQEASDIALQRQRDAHVKHIAALQAAWGSIDPEAANAATLQTAAWATYRAACFAPRV